MAGGILVQFISVFFKLMATIVLSAGSLYFGTGLLDRLTTEIDEWKEVKKGNVAVALLYISVLISMMLLLLPRIEEFVYYIDPSLPLPALAVTFLNFLLALPISIGIIWLTIHTVERLTSDVSEMAELKKGNVAVSLVFSVSVLLVSLAATIPMDSLFTLVKSIELVYV
jgi:uncharacterized membrane protein YjfL (UPF0719 family)